MGGGLHQPQRGILAMPKRWLLHPRGLGGGVSVQAALIKALSTARGWGEAGGGR